MAGQCFAQTPHLAYLTDGLGKHWEILANTYKAISMWHRHPPVDRGRARDRPGAEYRRRRPWPASRSSPTRPPWRSATADTQRTRWRACEPLPLGGSGSGAGQGRHPRGTDHAIADPAIRALRDRIDVTNDPAVPHDGADVTVRLSNGASAVRSVRACIGSRGRPMTNAELDRKFAAAAEGVLSKSKIDAYLASIRGVETLGDARVLAGGVHTA